MTSMFILIIFLISSSIVAYLALNNLGPVVVSTKVLSLGLAMTFAVYFVHSLVEAYSIHKRDSKIKHGKSDIVDLTKRIHQLEIENAKLQGPVDENSL